MYTPTAVPNDPAELPDYLSRELQALAQSLAGQMPFLQLQVLNKPPAKPREGMIVRADGINWNPSLGIGLYGYEAGAWILLGTPFFGTRVFGNEGADVLAARAGPVVASSVAANDGADALAASVGPLVAASSANTDGADVLAASVGPVVAAQTTSTDGADVLAARAG